MISDKQQHLKFNGRDPRKGFHSTSTVYYPLTMRNFVFGVFLYCLLRSRSGVHGFTTAGVVPVFRTSSVVLNAKGFGGTGGGFGKSAGTKKKSTKDIKRAKEKLLDQYGGDVARGTSERIQNAMSELPEHIQIASQLYQQVKRWDAYIDKLPVLQQSKLPQQDMEGARRAKEQLQHLYEQYPDELSDELMHNLFQRVTWDASADAKAARALMGNMPAHIEERVDKACSIIAEAVGSGGKCLDVGCGPGVLVPSLLKAGVSAKQIYGVDLSSEMIRNAQRTYRGPTFMVADFLQAMDEFESEEGFFDGILFCSSLHDLPNAKQALKRAASLLRPKGKVVVVHPQGAAHVAGQQKANPVMVRNGLPNKQEFIDMDLGLELLEAPAENDDEGYLAVLTK